MPGRLIIIGEFLACQRRPWISYYLLKPGLQNGLASYEHMYSLRLRDIFVRSD